MTGGARRSSRGQALMIAVLVLFSVATLAALFAAVISSQLAQVGRHADVVQLRNIAEAGLWFANQQLTYGIEGADWRPAQRAYRTGGGEVELKVSYGPAPEQPQSRFIRIVATAVFPDNPFLRHTILALKPLLLTDYARFITDRYETREPAALGVPGLEFGGKERTAAEGQYVFRISGPVRSNTDLIWYGPSRVDLYTGEGAVDGRTWQEFQILRDDRIEVSGQLVAGNPEIAPLSILDLFVNDISRASDVFRPTLGESAAYLGGYPDTVLGSPVVNTWRVLANLPPYSAGGTVGTLEPANLAPPRIRPPQIDAVDPDVQMNRYLALTRDSGEWQQPEEAGSTYINTGRYGWGWTNFGGVYIDNTDDIQYGHDLELLRLNWVGSVGIHGGILAGDLRTDFTNLTQTSPPNGPADWWDMTGRYYTPPGVEIILHGEAACPYVEIIRHDLKVVRDADGNITERFYWRYPSGNPVPLGKSFAFSGKCRPVGAAEPTNVKDNRAAFPFPPNGVIYAEGNVRIRGIMPSARVVGGLYPKTYFGGEWVQGAGRSRRYDLQVVSGGTIYIEGDLLSPRSAGLAITTAPTASNELMDTTREDADYGSRLALLARDYVCLNTTALNPRPRYALEPYTPEDGTETFYYNDAYPTYPTQGYPRDLIFRGLPQDWNVAPYNEPDTQPVVETDPLGIEFLYHSVRLRNEIRRQKAGLEADQDQVLADLRLVLGHSGWYSENPEDDTLPPSEPPAAVTNGEVDAPAVDVRVAIGPASGATTPTPFAWEHESESYTFLREEAADPVARDESYHWYLAEAPVTRLEFLPLITPEGITRQAMTVRRIADPVVDLLTGDDVLSFTPSVYPVRRVEVDPDTGAKKVVGWETAPDQLAYVLGPVAIAPPRGAAPLPVEIDALIYAQNGSWFVIPGPWFNEDPAEAVTPDYVSDRPGYHEPLNYQIRVYGAISENLPAPMGDVVDWTSKWSGPYGSATSLTYAYDPLLRTTRKAQDPLNPGSLITAPRFPRLPLTPDLMVWGERVSGPVGG